MRIGVPIRSFLLIALAALASCSRSAEQETATPPTAVLPPGPTSAPQLPASNPPASHGDAATQSQASLPKQEKPQTLDELLLFYPSKYPDGDWKPTGLDFEDVWFKADDGTRLHGWYCPCDKPRAIVLVAHGNAGNLS